MAVKPRGQHYQRILKNPGDYRFIVAIDIEDAKDLADAYRRLRAILPKECAYESTDEAYGPGGLTVDPAYLSRVRSSVLAGEEPVIEAPACMIRRGDKEVFSRDANGQYSLHWMKVKHPRSHRFQYTQEQLSKNTFVPGMRHDIELAEARFKRDDIRSAKVRRKRGLK